MEAKVEGQEQKDQQSEWTTVVVTSKKIQVNGIDHELAQPLVKAR